MSLFSENSGRWMVADQAVMKCGAADAVRTGPQFLRPWLHCKMLRGGAAELAGGLYCHGTALGLARSTELHAQQCTPPAAGPHTALPLRTVPPRCAA